MYVLFYITVCIYTIIWSREGIATFSVISVIFFECRSLRGCCTKVCYLKVIPVIAWQKKHVHAQTDR